MSDEQIAKAIMDEYKTVDSSIPTPENLAAEKERAATVRMNLAAAEEQDMTGIQKAGRTLTGGLFDPIAALQTGKTLLSGAIQYPFAVGKGVYGEATGQGKAEDITQQYMQKNVSPPASITGQRYLQNIGQTAENLGLEGLSGMPASQYIKGIPLTKGLTKKGLTEGVPAFIQEKNLLGRFKYKDKVPSIEELKQEATKGYDLADKAGLNYKGEDFGSFVANAEKTLDEKFSLSEKRHGGTLDVINTFKKFTTEPIKLKKIESLRADLNRVIKENARQGKESDLAASIDLKNQLDDFLDTTTPDSMAVSGGRPTKEVIAELQGARDAWKRARKAEVLADVFDYADIKSGSNFTSAGFEQAIRNRLSNIATNKNRLRMFNPEEQAAIIEIAKGGDIQNIFRQTGKYAPIGPVGTGASVYLGKELLGEEGKLAFPAISFGARKVSEQIAKNKFKNLEDLLKMGYSPTALRGTRGTQGVQATGLLGQTLMPQDPTLGLLGNTEQ
jgi:hypothetical protein